MIYVHRKHDVAVLSDLVGHNNCIQDFLSRLTIHVDPAHFTHCHGILLPTPHALWGNAVPGYDGHDNRQSHGRGSKIGLEHERQTLTATGRKGPCPGQACAMEHG